MSDVRLPGVVRSQEFTGRYYVFENYLGRMVGYVEKQDDGRWRVFSRRGTDLRFTTRLRREAVAWLFRHFQSKEHAHG